MKRLTCALVGHRWCGVRWHTETRWTWTCLRCDAERAP